ncbi:hypothetical protein F2Q69_00040106 [Brassica cretica]|uniref:Uncharacterized protein n=1 Tax=Brassica cretica TaxID=69181 RepID=A0A8S9NQ12_BRACR|nr:hypothetical protein F2Q69_00040106 [Brassica cretica]
MDFFFPCKDEVVTDKLRLDDPPWLAISTVGLIKSILIRENSENRRESEVCLPGGFVGVNLSREGNGSLGLVVLRGRMTLSRLFVRRMMAREKRRILPRK